MTAPSPVRLSTVVSCTCSWNSVFPPTFPISGSVQMTPRFPPAGPDGHGSPPSAVLSGRYDFLPLHVLRLIVFAGQFRGRLPGSCPPWGAPAAVQARQRAGVWIFMPASPFQRPCPKDHVHFVRLASAVVNPGSRLPEAVRELGEVPLTHIASLKEMIQELERRLRASGRENEEARRLMSIPGIGAITATAFQTFAPPMQASSWGATSPPGSNSSPVRTSAEACHRACPGEEICSCPPMSLVNNDYVSAAIRDSCLSPSRGVPKLTRVAVNMHFIDRLDEKEAGGT